MNILGPSWKWLLLLAAGSLGAAAAFTMSTIGPERYVATSTLLVYQQTTPGVVTAPDLDTSTRLATIVGLLASFDRVLDDAVKQGQLPMTASELGGGVSVAPLADTPLVEVQATSRDSELAQRMANSIAAAIRETNEADGRVPRGSISIVKTADRGLPVSNRLQNSVLGGALAAAFALAVLVIRDR